MMAKILLFLRDDDGGPAVEMGLIAPFLVTLLIGVITYGMVIFQIMSVNAAAQAGAMYGLLNGTSNLANIKAAEAAATELAITTPDPTLVCYCVVASLLSAKTCGQTCADGTTAGTYLTATTHYTTLQSISFLPTVTGTSVIRTN